MLVAVIDIKIVATTGADLNHLVRKILKNDFIIFYVIVNDPNGKAPPGKSDVGKLNRNKTFEAVNLYFAVFISS